MAISYHVEVREVGQASTRYEGITVLNYTVTSLTPSTDYEFRVREVDINGGITMWSAWTAWTAFSTSGGLVEVNLGLITETETVLPIVPTTDTVAPVLTLIGDANIVHKLGDAFTDPGALATDNIDPDTTVFSADVVDANTEGEYTLNYTHSDSAGNAATPIQRIVRVAAEAPATSYNIEVREDGGSATAYSGVTDLFLTVTSLTPDTLHEFRVQGVGDNPLALSQWSAWTQFTTLAVSNVEVNLGLITETESAFGITPSLGSNVEVNLGLITETESTLAITPVVGNDLNVAIGLVTETETVLGITPNLSGDQQVNLGLITESEQVLAISPQLDTGGNEIPAESYDIEIENVITGAVLQVNNNIPTTYTTTSDAGTNYRFRVRGRTLGGTAQSSWSSWSEIFTTHFTDSKAVVNSTDTINLDVLSVGFDDLVTENNVLDLLGTVDDVDAVVSVTFNGITYQATNRSGNWYVVIDEYGSRLGISTLDELDYTYGILLSGDMQDSGDDGILL